jgi:hypothetical protein
VYFSPHGGATAAVIRELNAAQPQVLMQAYSFTSAPIAKALLEAYKRGVKVLAVLDKSNETAKYSAATFLNNAHAGHSHPYGRQASASPARAVPAAQAGGNGEVHGNKHSKIYHLPTCPGYAGMNPASRVTFPPEAAAQQAGYRKAKNYP